MIVKRAFIETSVFTNMEFAVPFQFDGKMGLN